MIEQDFEVDFKHLLRLAMTQKVSWTKLKGFLNDLTSTFEASKKLNDVLLEEIQILHSRSFYETQVIANEALANTNEEETVSDDDSMALFADQESIDDKLNSGTDNEIEEDSLGTDNFFNDVTDDEPSKIEEYCFENDKNGIKEFSSTNTVMEESDIGLESVEIGMNKEETNEIEENGEAHINDDSSIQHDQRFEKVQEGNKINEVQGNSDASKSETDLQPIVFLSIAQSNRNSAEVLHYCNIQYCNR